MKCVSKELEFNSVNPIQLLNITENIKNVVEQSGIQNGLVLISTPHTTGRICINEPCVELEKDAVDFLTTLVENFETRHDKVAVDGRPNGRSHLLAYLMSSAETVPVTNGKANLGGWQAIYFTELDGPREKRKVEVKVLGE